MKSHRAHPYMPNSVPDAHQEMLNTLGVDSTETLFSQIPSEHRLEVPLNLPPALTSESALRRHMCDLLAKNQSCEDALNFLGGGCWQHHVPAICDELVQRSEFFTPVWGTVSSDLGRNQSWFEFTSQLGELIDLDLVALPVYSWGCAAGHAIRMATRLTGRKQVLVPQYLDPERLAVIRNYCEPSEMASHISIVEIAVDKSTHLLDIDDLNAKLSDNTAAVYIENPSFLGKIEHQAEIIVEAAHAHGAEAIVAIDPISLGVIKPPGQYGADIVVGSIQPLGIHMNCGGGLGGFIASRDEPRYAHEYPTLMISIAETIQNEKAFSLALFHQCSYGSREEGNDWTGNSVYLWTIAAAAYMSLLGPEGFREVGERIIQQAHYCASLLDNIDGIKVTPKKGIFKEFVVNFDETGKSVEQINQILLENEIFGGLDLSDSFPDLGQSALYCVTEIHTKADLTRLANVLTEACKK